MDAMMLLQVYISCWNWRQNKREPLRAPKHLVLPAMWAMNAFSCAAHTLQNQDGERGWKSPRDE